MDTQTVKPQKSISFSPTVDNVSSDSSTNQSDPQEKVNVNQSDHPHSHTPRATSKPSVRSISKSIKSRSRRRSTWFRRRFRCCGESKDSDSSDNYDIESRIRKRRKSHGDEEDIIRRLQQAVHGLGHRPTSYEIESEIIKWERMLEIEQKLYEESGRPKFKYKFFRKNRYLHEREHPLYGTNYEIRRKFRWKTLLKEYWTSICNLLRNTDFQAHDEKVHPEPFIYKRPISHSTVLGRNLIYESRFVAKVNAPSQTGSYPVRSELYQVTEHNMTHVYQAQSVIHKQFLALLKFKRVQTKWLSGLLAVVFSRKINSMPGLARTVLLQFKCNNNKVDIRFIRKTLDQIVNFTFYSAVRKLQRMPVYELHSFLADELIMLTTFHEEEYHHNYVELEDSTDSDLADEENNNDSSSSYLSSGDGDEYDIFDYEGMHKKVIGTVDKSSQELRTLLTIRLKRGLNLPHEGELSVLKFLRRERAQKERLASCWTMNDPVPVDHFIPASISKGRQKICYTIFHAVVIRGKDHFALSRLPVPRPQILRVTEAFISIQRGATYVEKLSNLVKSRMLQNAKQIATKRNINTWPKHKIRRHLWKVSDHVDDDVYDFLDRILTCVVVVVDKESEKVKDNPQKTMYLTPRTRRRMSDPHLQFLMEGARNDGRYEITTYNALALKQMAVTKWMKFLEEPPDIVYNDESESSDEIQAVDESKVFDVKSSSGSSSSLSSSDVSDEGGSRSIHRASVVESLVPGGFYNAAHYATKSKYIITHEKLVQRDRKELFREDSNMSLDDDDIEIRNTTKKVKHISAKRWQRARRDSQFQKKFKYNNNELKLHKGVELEAERRALLTLPGRSKSLEFLKHERGHQIRRAMSFQSLQHFLRSEPEFIDIQREGWQSSRQLAQRMSQSFNDEDPVEKNCPTMNYLTVGKTLIVGLPSSLTLRRRSSVRPHRPPQT